MLNAGWFSQNLYSIKVISCNFTTVNDFVSTVYRPIRLTQASVVPNSDLPGMRFFVYCICLLMWHSHLNDMEIPETKRFIPTGFELGTTLS